MAAPALAINIANHKGTLLVSPVWGIVVFSALELAVSLVLGPSVSLIIGFSVSSVFGLDSLIGPTIPKSMIPDSVTSTLKNDEYQLVLVNSEYKVATDELNAQIKELNQILHKHFV